MSGFLVVVLHLLLLGEGAVPVQLQEEVLAGLLVKLGARAMIDIEMDAKVLEGLAHHRMVLVHDGFRRGAILHGPNGDGRAMLITATDEKHLLATRTQATYIDVRRQVSPSDVPDVQGAIGIGQGGGNGGACWFLHDLLLRPAKVPK